MITFGYNEKEGVQSNHSILNYMLLPLSVCLPLALDLPGQQAAKLLD
jgi:hypothetical protein